MSRRLFVIAAIAAGAVAVWLRAASVIPPSLESLVPPIAGLRVADLHDVFEETHNGHRHEAIDIMEPRGTPVHAVTAGTIRKLFLSKPGGNTIYEFDESQTYCYYYAHLDRYAEGLREGDHVAAGEVIAYVGSTGNASPEAPHLHFAAFELTSAKEWWKGRAVNPYTELLEAVRRAEAERAR